MWCGNPLAPDLHIASAAMAITYPAQYTFAGGSGGSGGGDGNPDADQLMNNNDPDDDGPDLPGGGGPIGGVEQLAYNPDEHPQSLCSSPPNIFDGTRDKVDLFLQAFGLYRVINH
jgi:hypothetical protein